MERVGVPCVTFEFGFVIGAFEAETFVTERVGFA